MTSGESKPDISCPYLLMASLELTILSRADVLLNGPSFHCGHDMGLPIALVMCNVVLDQSF